MVSPELQSTPSKFERFARRIGILPNSKQQKIINQNFALTQIKLAESRDNEYFRQHQIIFHSNACPSKIEYVLGITRTDPHPNQPLNMTVCLHKLPSMAKQLRERYQPYLTA